VVTCGSPLEALTLMRRHYYALTNYLRSRNQHEEHTSGLGSSADATLAATCAPPVRPGVEGPDSHLD